MPKSLKGGTESQRKFATNIRAQVLKKYPWGVDSGAADLLLNRLNNITTPLFFIKYKEVLGLGEVVKCLSLYDQENYNRRSKFAQAKK